MGGSTEKKQVNRNERKDENKWEVKKDRILTKFHVRCWFGVCRVRQIMRTAEEVRGVIDRGVFTGRLVYW